MQPATHGQQQQQRLAPGMGTGTGPPAPQRRSLLGSTRTEKQQKQTLHAHAHEGLGMGGGSARNGVVIGNTNGFATLGASGSGSTVPQKRKLGFGIGHGNPQGQGQGHGHGGSNKARREDDGGRRREGEGLAGKPHSRAGGAARQGANALGGPPRGAANGGSANADTGDEIRCRCGSSVDDGFSIACDVCGRWCHAACFGIAEGSVPEEWRCWVCAPGDFPALPNAPAPTPNNRRRRASISARRANTVDPAPGASNATANGTNSDTAVEEQLAEDERMQYVLIEDDIVPHANTQRKLRAYAATWRGVSALSPAPTETASLAQGHTPFVFPAPPAAHPTLLQPIVPSSHSSASCIYPFGVGAPSSSTPSVSTSFLPPTFALHTASPAPPRTLLARYPALITPSSAYLAAPTNGYAHAGLPKRFVHLVGPPLDLALDARGSGGRGRWVRSGCWPNAEVRAFVCPSPGEGGRGGRRRGGGDAGGGEGRDGERRGEGEGEGGGGEDECRTHFGIFATRALREGEEIVVGWEWDDANAMHRVGEVAGVNGVGLPSAPTPAQRHLIAQLANILHTLGSSECACTPASSTSTPAAPALPSLPPPSTRPPVSKGRRTTPGSERERSSVSAAMDKRAVSAEVERQEEEEGEGDEHPERACVIRAIEDVVFPPVPSFRASQHTDDEQMEVDIEGEDGARMQGSSSSSITSLATPRLGGASSLAPAAVIRRASLSPAAPSSSSLHPHAAAAAAATSSSSSSSATSASTSKRTRKRLAGPGVPPPSPEAPDPRWGPLIGASRGVRAVESVRGSGGWGGVVLDRPQPPHVPSTSFVSGSGAGAGRRVVYGAFAPEGMGYAGEGGEDVGGEGYGYGYADSGASTSRAGPSTSKDYAVRERAGGWDVVPDASYTTSSSSYVARASSSARRVWDEMEEDVDVDVVGDGDEAPARSERVRGKSRRRERERAEEQRVQEEVCPPKMRKRWKGGAADSTPAIQAAALPRIVTQTQMRPPPVPDKGKGKARAQDEAMDVDANVDVEALDEQSAHSLTGRPPLVPPPPPPHLQPSPSSLAAGTSPSADFARLTIQSPHPGAGVPRPAWSSSFGPGMDVDVPPHDDARIAHGEGDEKHAAEDVEPAASAHEAVEAVASPSVRAESPVADTSPADAHPSPPPPPHFVEPVVDAPPEDGHDVSASSDATDYHEPEDQDLLKADGVEDPYRSSPQSPSPAPESASEGRLTPPRIREEEADDDALLRERESAVTDVGEPPAYEGGASTPAWNGGTSVSPEVTAPMPLAREPTPPPAPPPAPAPPPVVKLGFKEWQARRKLEKAKEVEEAQERERDKLQQLELERERERERERGREKEKDDAQGEDKENKVVPKPEDGLARILDGIRRSAVGDKPPPDAPVRDDVEMADAPPVPRAPSPPPSTVVSVEAPKAKGTPLTFPAFAATGPEHLSPLSVSSSLHSRTPSPRLVNGLTREPSPLVVDGQGSPAMPNGIFKFTGSPFLNSSASSEPRRALPSLLRDPPPPFPDVDRRLSKPFTTAATASPPPLASNGAVKRFPNIPSLLHRSLPPESSPLSFSSHARVPSQEEGEILSPTLTAPLPLASRFTAGPQSTPRTSFASSSGPRRPSPFGSSFGPSRTSSFASGSGFSSSSGPPRAAPFTPSPVPPHASPFASSSVPPTQPRSHQANLMQRLPPSAPKALREAQASTAATAGPSGGAGRGGRFNGLVPQTMPANLLEPLPRTNRRGGNGRKRR